MGKKESETEEEPKQAQEEISSLPHTVEAQSEAEAQWRAEIDLTLNQFIAELVEKQNGTPKNLTIDAETLRPLLPKLLKPTMAGIEEQLRLFVSQLQSQLPKVAHHLTEAPPQGSTQQASQGSQPTRHSAELTQAKEAPFSPGETDPAELGDELSTEPQKPPLNQLIQPLITQLFQSGMQQLLQKVEASTQPPEEPSPQSKPSASQATVQSPEPIVQTEKSSAPTSIDLTPVFKALFRPPKK